MSLAEQDRGFTITPVSDVRLPPSGSGSSSFPNGIAAALEACGPDRRAVLLPDLDVRQEPLVLIDLPGSPIGFLEMTDARATVAVATSEDGCAGPFDVHVVDVDLSDFTVTSMPVEAGVASASVRAIQPTVDITLSGVIIEPFA